MRIYKELEAIGFFKWYCTQYGGLNYTEYKEVYDQLPLDNLIRTELNACVFKFFKEKYNLVSYIHPFSLLEDNGFWCYDITNFIQNWDESVNMYSPDETELECIKKLIEIVKENKL